MSNSVNFYEFIGFITFNIAVHELIFAYTYSFLLDRILVSMVPRATVRTLKPKNLKNLKNLKTFLKNLRFLPALILLVFCPALAGKLNEFNSPSSSTCQYLVDIRCAQPKALCETGLMADAIAKTPYLINSLNR